MENEVQEYKYMVVTRCFTFNHASYIVDAMNGFTMQETTFPVAYLIVDDASTDGEPVVIRQYLAEHFEKSYRTEETDDYYLICANHKANHNCTFIVFLLKYNHHSIKKSKSPYLSEWQDNAKYIAFCEGDDYWIESKKLQKQVLFLDDNPFYVMSHTGIKYYYEYEDCFYNSKDIEINTYIQKEGLTKERILSDYRIQTVSVVVEAKAFSKAMEMDPFLFGGYFLMGDVQLWYNLFKIGKIHFLPESTCVYRKNEGSATRSTSIEKSLRFSLSSKELRLYLAKNDNLSPLYEKKAFKDYELALKRYMYYRPDFVPLFPVNSDNSSKSKNTIWVLLLKLFYSFVHKHKAFIGYMRRKGKLKI